MKNKNLQSCLIYGSCEKSYPQAKKLSTELSTREKKLLVKHFPQTFKFILKLRVSDTFPKPLCFSLYNAKITMQNDER